MANVGGARPGAGRPKGSLNKRSVELLAAVAAEGVTPVEYMLNVLRDENADEKLRQWAAEKAAPFVHPKPQPVARPINIVLPDTSTLEGIAEALNCITQAVASGDITTSEAQGLVSIVEAQRKTVETGEVLQRIVELEAALERRNAAA